MRIFTVVFDRPGQKKYSRLLNVFLKSCAAKMPNVEVDVLRIKGPDTMTLGHRVACEDNTEKLAFWVDYIKKAKEPVALMDCDILIRGDIRDAFDHEFDVAYTLNGAGGLNAGVVFVRPTQYSVEFFELWKEINDQMFFDESFHRKWRKKYIGMNQTALGYILEHPDLHSASLKFLPSHVYNAADYDHPVVDDATKVLHVKGDLRDDFLSGGKFYKRLFREWILYEDPEYFLKQNMNHFQEVHGYAPNMQDPKTFSEKIMWRKWNDRRPILAMACDKIESREYARKILGDQYILPDPEPGQDFVMKVTRASGSNVFSPIDEDKEQKISRWMSEDYGVEKGEWGYSQGPQRLVSEPLLKPWPDVLRFHCFDGTCQALEVYRYHRGAPKPEVRDITFYDRAGNWIDVKINGRPQGDAPFQEAEHMEKSELLAVGFDYVRVDFLLHKGRIYFSELTVYPVSGTARYEPRSFDAWLGTFWTIQEREENHG